MQSVTLKLPLKLVADLAEIAAANGDTFEEVCTVALMHGMSSPKDNFGVTLGGALAVNEVSHAN